jgi:DNA-binding response OmpR family regulator/DNA-binding CsgD family transcriptional regulator
MPTIPPTTTAARPPTVLLVDDVPDNLTLLIDLLRGAGYEIRVAESGERALKQLPLVNPDIILLDVMLPGLDGFSTCRRLKAEAQWKDVPVLFVTASNDLGDKIRGFEAGGVDYLTKPFHPHEVLARVSAHVQLASLRRALEQKNAELTEEVATRIEAERILHESLDRALVVATTDGTLLFATHQATRLLARVFPDAPAGRLPPAVLGWALGSERRTDEVAPQVRAQIFGEPGTGRGFALLLEDLAWQPKVERLTALGLTPREAEVLYWFAEGKGAPEIGLILGVSHNTARKHAQRVLEKLGVENRLAAVRIARERLGLPG